MTKPEKVYLPVSDKIITLLDAIAAVLGTAECPKGFVDQEWVMLSTGPFQASFLVKAKKSQ